MSKRFKSFLAVENRLLFSKKGLYVMFCAIWYHLYSLKNVKNHPWKSVTFSKIVKLKACNFTKSNIPPWVFFTFIKLHKWHPIAKRITYNYDVHGNGRGEES